MSQVFQLLGHSHFGVRAKASFIRTKCFSTYFSLPSSTSSPSLFFFSAACLICFLLPSTSLPMYLSYFRGKWTISGRAFQLNSVSASSLFQSRQAGHRHGNNICEDMGSQAVSTDAFLTGSDLVSHAGHGNIHELAFSKYIGIFENCPGDG